MLKKHNVSYHWMQSVLSAGAIIKELPKNSVIFASSEPTNKWHNLLVWRATPNH